jgi:lantibiotic transport system permease protein
MNLLISLRSELLKTKRTVSLYLCGIAAALIPTIFLLDFSFETLEPETLKDPWNAFFIGGLSGFSFIILPMYVILTCTLLPQLEYRNNTWKQVLVSPQPKFYFFISKFLTIHFFILLLLLFFTLLMLSTAGVAQLIRPDVVLYSDKSNWNKFFNKMGNVYLSILALSAIQFWMGTKFKNFIVPVGVGFALWMLGTILLFEFKWVHADMFPYTFPTLNVFPANKISNSMIGWYSFGYMVLFVGLGYWDFSRKRIKA